MIKQLQKQKYYIHLLQISLALFLSYATCTNVAKVFYHYGD